MESEQDKVQDDANQPIEEQKEENPEHHDDVQPTEDNAKNEEENKETNHVGDNAKPSEEIKEETKKVVEDTPENRQQSKLYF